MAVLYHYSERFPGLTGAKYTKMTPVMRDWDYESLLSRGHVKDVNGHYVARPFDKFFNYEEIINGQTGELTDLGKMLLQYNEPMLHPNLEGPFRVMDKLDGSLGIAFYWNGEWHVKTGGSFDSPEALWATKWLRNYVKTSVMDQGKTYLFEIIWLETEQTHPLSHFYESSELVLIGVVDNETGIELSGAELSKTAELIGTRIAEIYEFDNLKDIYEYAHNLPSDKEGVVVTFKSGFKLKIKGVQFLELQKLFNGISKDFVLENIKDGKYVGQIIPEELVDIHNFIKEIEGVYAVTKGIVNGWIKTLLAQVPDSSNRKEAWAYLSEVKTPLVKFFSGYIINSWQNTLIGARREMDFDKPFIKWAKECYNA